jgi:signal transduction histidine kinase
MSVGLLSEAFQNFTKASKSLEAYYELLQEKVKYLTNELEKKNKEIQAALSDAERNKDYLKAILYNLEEAIIVVDPEDRVTMLNKSAEELLGIPLSDAIGKVFKNLHFSICKNNSETILTVNGKQYTIIVSSSPIVDSRGSLRGNVILIKDITRLRELEIQQERDQRLKAMGEMAAKIVHEIRNPLCSMQLFSSMLESELENTPRKELARGISTGISSLNTILTNMLLFARPHRPSMKCIPLDRVVEESVAMLTPLIKSRNIRLRKSFSRCEVSGDEELLKQVFINIILNAIQSLPNGGDLEIMIKANCNSVVVHVKDNGAGINSKDLEKIFNPFFTTKDTGTGLGLTIASQIMQAHDGYIKVYSEEDKGSTFSLHFLKREGLWNQKR